jgi:hypothetical protein
VQSKVDKKGNYKKQKLKIARVYVKEWELRIGRMGVKDRKNGS